MIIICLFGTKFVLLPKKEQLVKKPMLEEAGGEGHILNINDGVEEY